MTRSRPTEGDATPSGRSQRWRAAVDIENRIAAIDAEVGTRRPDEKVRALRCEASRLRAEHTRLIALEGLCWPLRADAHATVLGDLQRADSQIQDHSRAPHTAARGIHPSDELR